MVDEEYKLERGVSCALWWKDWAVLIDVKVAFAWKNRM